MALQHVAGLYYGPSEIQGRGVFCAVDLEANDVIEICPVIVLPSTETAWLKHSKLFEYYFSWNCNPELSAIALGYGSLYNHNDDPNADFVPDYGSDTITFIALRRISAGQEITIDYQAGAVTKALWFKPLS